MSSWRSTASSERTLSLLRPCSPTWKADLWIFGYVFGHGRFLPASHTIRCTSSCLLAVPLQLRQCWSESAARKRRPHVLDLRCRVRKQTRLSPVGIGPDMLPAQLAKRLPTCTLMPSRDLCPTKASTSNDLTRIAGGRSQACMHHHSRCIAFSLASTTRVQSQVVQRLF